jgi:hypothetical protein
VQNRMGKDHQRAARQRAPALQFRYPLRLGNLRRRGREVPAFPSIFFGVFHYA